MTNGEERAAFADAGQSRWTKGRIASLVLLLALLTVGLISTLNRQKGDLIVYTRAATRALEGTEAYVVEPSSFTHPPAQLILFTPVALFPRTGERVAWYLINVALLAGVAWFLRSIVRAEVAARGTKLRTVWFIVIVLAVCARYLTAPLENQSNDLPILFLMTWCAYARGVGRDVLGGGAAGAATALKATPLLYLPILVWHRRVGGVMSFVVIAASLSLAPDFLFPREDGMRWVQAWYDTFVGKNEIGAPAEAEGGWMAWNVLNQSLGGTLYRLSRPETFSREALRDFSLWSPTDGVLRATTLAAQAGVLALVALAVGWPSAGAKDAPDRRMRRLGEVSAVVCGMVLLSPMSSKAHFCVLLLPTTYMLLHLSTRGRDLIVAGCLLATFMLGSLTSKGMIGVPLGDAVLARGSVTWCALILLIGTVRVAMVRRSADARSSAAAAVMA